MHRITPSIAMFFLLLLQGCASSSWTRTELYLGLTKPTGPDVMEIEFQSFLDQVVTPRFPGGYTVVQGQGRWREEQGRLRTEPSRVLIILHRRDGQENEKIEQIREAYKQRFAQEAVLRVDEPAAVSF